MTKIALSLRHLLLKNQNIHVTQNQLKIKDESSPMLNASTNLNDSENNTI